MYIYNIAKLVILEQLPLQQTPFPVHGMKEEARKFQTTSSEVERFDIVACAPLNYKRLTSTFKPYCERQLP